MKLNRPRLDADSAFSMVANLCFSPHPREWPFIFGRGLPMFVLVLSSLAWWAMLGALFMAAMLIPQVVDHDSESESATALSH